MTEKPGIGIVCYPTSGGSGIVATELGIALAGRGYPVHFFSYKKPFRLADGVENITVHEVETPPYPLFKFPPYCMSLASSMSEAMERGDVRIIHAHYAVPHAAAALLARLMVGKGDARVVTTLHGTDIVLVGHDPSYRTATKFSIEKSDLVTAVSSWLAKETVDRFGISREIEVIPNFVDTGWFKPDPGRPRPSLGVCCVHASNFRPVKRVRDVMRAFSVLSRNLRPGVPAELWMVGDGPEKQSAELEAEALGLSARVRFLGERTDVDALFARSHFCFLPSEFESFGLSALEAMSCGSVPLTYRVGGIPEFLDHGENGLMSDLGDWESLGTMAARLASDDEMHARFSLAARRKAEGEYPLEKGVDAYEAAYLRALKSPAPCDCA